MNISDKNIRSAFKKRPIKSMARGYLKPEYDSRGSFYNKAETDDDKLYSYGTLVADIVDGEPVLYPDWSYSQTTIRHVREWLRQHGFEAGSKADIAATYKVIQNSRKPITSALSYDITDNFDFEVIRFDSIQEEYLGLDFEVGEIIDLNNLDGMAEPINGYADAEVDYEGGDACIKITFYGMNPEFDGEQDVPDYIEDCQVWVRPYATNAAIDRIVNELNGNFN